MCRLFGRKYASRQLLLLEDTLRVIHNVENSLDNKNEEEERERKEIRQFHNSK